VILQIDGCFYKMDCLCWCLTRAFGESNQGEFLKEMKDMFTVLAQFLAVESDVVMSTQVCGRFCHIFVFSAYLTTHEASWYVISVVSVCLSVCMFELSKALTY